MKGFTFIEIILVVAIMLTISIMTPTFYSRFLLQNSVANTTDQLAGSMRKAQFQSMMGKNADSWSVNYSANTITLYKGNNFGVRDPSFDEKFTVNPNISVSGFTDLNFAKVSGLPSPGPFPLNVSISSSSGNNSDVVTVNSQGVVSR